MAGNRAFFRFGLGLGSVLLGLALSAHAAAPNASAEAAKAECTTCHEQGAKLEKSAHTGLTCDTCHESHDQYPHATNIPKPACVTCHADQAGAYASGVHGMARKAGN